VTNGALLTYLLRGFDDSSTPNFTPIGATCYSCGGEKPQNRPLSNRNTGAMHACSAASKPVFNILTRLNWRQLSFLVNGESWDIDDLLAVSHRILQTDLRIW